MAGLFDSIFAIDDTFELDFPVTGASSTAGGFLRASTTSVQLSCTNGNSAENYYLVTVTGQQKVDRRGSIYIDSYNVSMTPTLQSAQLLDDSPGTTVGNCTVTKGSSTSISGSVGYMGNQGTSSVTVSDTESSSFSYSVPDVTVQNQSHQASPNTASWSFTVSEGSGIQGADFDFKVQALFVIDRSQDAAYNATPGSNGLFTVDLGFSINISDHDGHDGTRWFDTFHGELTPHLPPGSQFNYTNDRIGIIILPSKAVTVPVPPPYKAS